MQALQLLIIFSSCCSHPCPVVPPVHLKANTRSFLYLSITVKEAAITNRHPLQWLLLGGCYVWSPRCPLPGNTKHLSCPLLQSGDLGLNSITFLWGYEPQPPFPQRLSNGNLKAVLLALGGTNVRGSWSSRAPPLQGLGCSCSPPRWSPGELFPCPIFSLPFS